ncbi:hypothetical protein C8Q79DRAFT_1004246 [Trametes meyenii]|nr:hypothetical protein C8Q79DRAFT_1004246 [Trametes meyenii]
MTDEAVQLSREAKSFQHNLKESLKTKDPWERETDFTRKQLRRNCLRLLLLHPYAPESKDAETMLWMQTSYAFILVYKQRIGALDRAIHGPSRPQQQQQQGQGQGQQSGQQQQSRQHGGHGVVEYRKLLQRFRQFLADESKFWIQLIVRIRRIFQLDDAQSVLTELELLPDDEPAVEGGPPKRNHFQFPSDTDVTAVAPSLTPATREQRESRMALLSKALVCLGDIERYKEQYNEAGGRPRAGHEDGPPAVNPGNQKGGRGRKGGAPPPNGAPPLLARMRDYHKALQCYRQARILLPQDGKPAHQMAILASYQKDTFASLAHYYRALCVRAPYDTAADNLGTVLTKALDAWKARGAKKEKEREKELARGETPSMAPRLRVEAFKEKLIVLHALWRLPMEEAETIAPNLSQKIADDFKGLVLERVLPLEIILKAVVLAQGALCKHRMFRNSTSNGHRKSVPAKASAAVESSIAAHLLAMHRVLLEVGVVQIAEAPPEDAGEHDLAQRITAEFRRTLPALRIASKWLRANIRYLAQAWQQANGNGVPTDVDVGSSKPKGRDRRRHDGRSTSAPPALAIPGLTKFWQVYAQFSTNLWRAFPQDKLPKVATTLEEDIELSGFLPLKKFIPSEVIDAAATAREHAKENRNGAPNSPFQVVQPEQVHPNEEQLMRIADLLADAQALARDEICPVNVSDGRFSSEGLREQHGVHKRTPTQQKRQSQTQPQPQPQSRPPPSREHLKQPLPPKISPKFISPLTSEPQEAELDDDNMTDVTRTGDELLEAIVQTVLGPPTEAGEDDDDDEEDEIVWKPGALSPPLVAPQDSPFVSTVPTTAPLPATSPPRTLLPSSAVPALIPRSPPSISPSFVPKRSLDPVPPLGLAAGVTTAQDILANVLRNTPKGDPTRSLHTRQASAPPAHMLFGSNPLGGSPSIWSSNENEGLGFPSVAGTTSTPSYQSHQVQSQPPTSNPSAYYQTSLGLGQGSVPLGVARSYSGVSPIGQGHQRVHSLSVGRSPMHPSSQGTQIYSSSQTQPPLPDGFGSYPAFTEQSSVPYSTGVPAAFADPVYPRRLESGYLRQDPLGYPDRSVPYHLDPRVNGGHHGDAYPPLASMAQLWNNTG